ncbi:MAG TPA: hypothetical protein VHD56_19160 [Tepidisphaeraceae bacterium]|nr:hypothetical protein [Tepidisphaeraceae bacterium]
MAYRKPFTPQQRRDAIPAYRSYRKHRRRLRLYYPPSNLEQMKLLMDYDEEIRQIANQLKKPDVKVDINALNTADAMARWIGTEYWRLNSIL